MWAGVDRRWGGRRAGWLLVRGWTGGWIETRGMVAGGRAGRREEVARLFVCQPRWDPLPIHSLSPIPRYLGHRTRSTRALPVQLPPQNAPHRDDVYGCVCRVYSICVCMFIHVQARVSARALLYTSRLCVTPYKHHLHLLGATLCAGYVANT